ncbi:hypothetical protein AMATHDRAFT_96601, partial [Amanita thiersii Skay4041]
KAFAIATGIVTVFGAGLVWGVRVWMGVQDTREFAQRARTAILTYLPSLAARIHRAPETEEERAMLDGADYSSPSPVLDQDVGAWDAAESEKRLQAAYDKGGTAMWGRMALREIEAESRYEQEKR